MVEIQPSIWILGIRIDEPVTTITDLLISVICFYAFYRLYKVPNRNKMHLYLKIYFISMGLATAAGGIIGHGFLYLFSFSWKLAGWLTSMVSVAMLERASIEYSRRLIRPSVGVILSRLNVVELVTFMTITIVTLNFFYVEVHSTYGLLCIVASLNLFAYLKTKNHSSRLFLLAISISAFSALIFMNKWGIHKYFNHFDISHTFMALAAWIFYMGARKAIFDTIVNS